MSDRLASRACELARDATTAKLAAEVAAPRTRDPLLDLVVTLGSEARDADRCANLAFYVTTPFERSYYRAQTIEAARALAKKLSAIVDRLEDEIHA